MRKPIVSTTLGCEMLIADTPSDFAQATLALLNDEAKRAAMGEAAYHFVAATYDWSTIVPKLEHIHQNLVSMNR